MTQTNIIDPATGDYINGDYIDNNGNRRNKRGKIVAPNMEYVNECCRIFNTDKTKKKIDIDNDDWEAKILSRDRRGDDE